VLEQCSGNVTNTITQTKVISGGALTSIWPGCSSVTVQYKWNENDQISPGGSDTAYTIVYKDSFGSGSFNVNAIPPANVAYQYPCDATLQNVTGYTETISNPVGTNCPTTITVINWQQH
jgi:hypothetical protein